MMHRVSREQLVYAMSRHNKPVLEVDSGARLLFETCDCFQDQIEGEASRFDGVDWSRVNPATGPVSVRGAEPGDVLAVEIEHISVGPRAVMVTAPGLGIWGHRIEQPSIRSVPIIDGQALMPGGVTVPLRPMIGVIGTAPAGDPVPCGVPDAHGGNMDCKLICAGHTLYLPVQVSGALLALGDLHAAMGDGEVSVCGLEIAGEVQLRLHLIKQCPWPMPMIATPEHVYTLGSAVTLDDAALLASRQMLALLNGQTRLGEVDALNLMSIAGNLQVCQIVDPQKTCRFEMPRAMLAQLGLTL
ncbi:acetamidase/formamidase family protein [Paucibacter sp. APW11]|uniref:Acetamidase/formamidase family protein n=1 Tax=Roseateles aquae TaxID=3077235 RepID=A0ABU3P905_9BURK|nr:acetamidase/formamidase family protein [Paucibacter sp. APW11]MDT8998231.1 acetamidase/formamidase family protein [Paucibacter sp. APW11]